MIDKFKKLVAVAEAMAAEWGEMGVDVEGVEVQVEGLGGTVKLGTTHVGGSYCPDDNVVHPVYYIGYDTRYYSWRDNSWVKDEPMIVGAPSPFEVREQEIDELPF